MFASNDSEMSWEEIEQYNRDEMEMIELPDRIKEHQRNIDKRINPQTGGPMTNNHKRTLQIVIKKLKDRLKDLRQQYGRQWEDKD